MSLQFWLLRVWSGSRLSPSGNLRREFNEAHPIHERLGDVASRGRAIRRRQPCASAGKETEHPVHHGRRHRLDAAELLPPRPDGRRNAEHRPHRQRRRHVHDLLRRVELHRRALRVRHRHAPVPRGHGPAAVAGRDFVSAPRHAVPRPVPVEPRLHDRRVRQEPPRRSSGFAADGARVPGILGLPLSPGRDAAGELPGHQQQPDQAGRRAADEDGSDSRHPGNAGRDRSQGRRLHGARRGRSCG